MINIRRTFNNKIDYAQRQNKDIVLIKFDAKIVLT